MNKIILVAVGISVFSSFIPNSIATTCKELEDGSIARAKGIAETVHRTDYFLANKYPRLLSKAGKYEILKRDDLIDLVHMYGKMIGLFKDFYFEIPSYIGIYVTVANFAHSDACKQGTPSFNWAVDTYNENFENFNSRGPKLGNKILFKLQAIESYYTDHPLKFLDPSK